MRQFDVPLSQLAESSAAHQREIDRRGECAQRMIGADVRGRAFAANMLLASVERQAKCAAAVAIALLTLTGAAAVAAALHRAYSIGWVSATVASALLLLLPLGLETRTVIALLCGPMVGIAVHLAALARMPHG